MDKTNVRFLGRSFIALAAGLSWMPGAAVAVTTYNDALFDWAGNDYGNTYIDISSVVITNDASNIYFQINLNPGTTSDPLAGGTGTNPSPVDLLTNDNQTYGLYEIEMETAAGGGSTAISNPYGEPIGISTGMNYWVAAWTNQSGTSTAGSDGSAIYQYSSSAWNQLAVGTGTDTGPYPSETATSLLIPYSLSTLGLSVGSTFNFDVVTTFGNTAEGVYDALDSGAAATAAAGNQPWDATPYDSATATGSTYSTTTYTITTPAFTWNDTGAGTGGDGVTWDVNNNYNWNNGIYADTYTDGSNVTFNDVNDNNYAVTLNTPVSPNSVMFDNDSAPYTISGTGSIGGTGSLTMNGTSTVFLNNTGGNTYSGGTNVTAGTLVIGAAGALPANSSVSITGGTLQLAVNTDPAGGETLSSLSISAGGALDLGNNHMIISDPGGGIDSTIRAYLAAGYNGGSWNGASATSGVIITSAPITIGSGTYSIGYADGANNVVAGLLSGELEVAYTLAGDANLDGKVDSADFGILADNYGASGAVWDEGDFNYDGKVDSADFGILAVNYGQSAGSNADVVTAADWSALDAFAAANGITLSDVPEPTFLGLSMLAGFGVLARRRRK